MCIFSLSPEPCDAGGLVRFRLDTRLSRGAAFLLAGLVRGGGLMGGAWAGGRLIRERLASVQTRVWKQTEAVSTETTDERRPSLRLTFHLSQGRRARGVSLGLDAADASGESDSVL